MIARYNDVMACVTDRPKTTRRLTYEALGTTDYEMMIRTLRVLTKAKNYKEAVSKEVYILGSSRRTLVWAVPGTEIPDRVMDPDAEVPRPVEGYTVQEWADTMEDVARYIAEHSNTSICHVADALGLSYNATKCMVIDLQEKGRIVHRGRVAYGRRKDGSFRYLWAYRAVME